MLDHPTTTPKFYLFGDDRFKSDESLTQSINIPKRQLKDMIIDTKLRATLTPEVPQGGRFSESPLPLESPEINLRNLFNSKNDILKFPIESSHSYSYAHLSPNSLSLRLNVLKRSLEILRDRPNLIQNLKQDVPKKLISAIENRRLISQEPSNSNTSRNLQSNASSAALAALFRPTMKRADSFPVDEMYSQNKAPLLKSISANTANNSQESLELPKYEAYSQEITEIIDLLENNNVNIINNQDLTSTLHSLSLRQDSDYRVKYEILKNKLIYALATPFVDTSVMTTIGSGNNNNGKLSPVIHPSTVALNMLSGSTAPNNRNFFNSSGARPFHASGKHSLPQLIFTIDCDAPWYVKAANDLACLMFGVLKNMIKSLSLMDLIAPQFREFVTDRISRSLSGELNNQATMSNSDIIFAGEIVAISRPGDKRYAWTSLWAKKKGKLIIFMFDQIPCDAIDIVISRDSDKMSENGEFNILSKEVVAGNMVPEHQQPEKLSKISYSMNKFLNEVVTKDPDDFQFNNYLPSEAINLRRYFTLQVDDENIPCAVTSNPLEIHPNKFEMKLKIHSLPYIAGIFITDSNFRIISCNNAIARNLFGASSIDLFGKSINTVINDFEEIFRVGMSDNSSISMEPGLVLPEHFFRKYNGLLKSRIDATSFEENFINSKGLRGTHVDGMSFFVDVQMRVGAPDTYVLWVTYCRQSTTTNDFERIYNLDDDNLKSDEVSKSNIDSNASNANEFSSLKPGFNRDMVGNERGFTRLPSQLKLFEDTSLPTVTGEIIRHNSTRTPKNNTKRFSDHVESGNSSISSLTNLNMSETSRGSTLDTKTSDLLNSKPTPLSKFLVSFDKDFEQELLAQEEEEIQQKHELSKFWPTEIGTKRRIKKIDEFNVVRELGEGSYGKVVLAQHKGDEAYEIIIKCIDKERILVDTWVRDRKLGTIPSEIQIMATLVKEIHPNIMRIIDFFEDKQYYYLETPIFGNPPAIDLFDYIEIRTDMSERECQFIFKQICSAILHLHKHGIIHRDIKDENIIVDERGVIKLIDFGSASYSKLGPFDVFVGTIDYASPEVLRGEKYDGKPQDIWALGILLYTILLKENPFYNVDEIMEGNLRLPNIISEQAIDLIKSILVREVELRPTITDILEHEWLQ